LTANRSGFNQDRTIGHWPEKMPKKEAAEEFSGLRVGRESSAPELCDAGWLWAPFQSSQIKLQDLEFLSNHAKQALVTDKVWARVT
jgi:hypothetical protein